MIEFVSRQYDLDVLARELLADLKPAIVHEASDNHG